MKDFLEGLEANVDKIIAESAPLNEAEGSGQTFSELASGAKWGYIPKPKNGKGFGSANNSLLFIKENSADSWDIYILKSAAGEKVGNKDDRSAAASVRKRPGSEAKNEAKEIAKYMALTESILGSKSKQLNEAASGNIEGDAAKLKDDSWKTVKALKGLKFSELLEKCVAVVSPKSGKSSSFLN